MLVGRRRDIVSRYYDIVGDGTWVATWTSRLDGPGELAVAGYYYTLGIPAFSGRLELSDQGGRVLAIAHRFGWRRWTVSAEGRDYPFRYGSILGRELLLDEGDRTVGAIRLCGGPRVEIQADLPTVPLAPAALAMVVALTKWQQGTRG